MLVLQEVQSLATGPPANFAGWTKPPAQIAPCLKHQRTTSEEQGLFTAEEAKVSGVCTGTQIYFSTKAAAEKGQSGQHFARYSSLQAKQCAD